MLIVGKIKKTWTGILISAGVGLLGLAVSTITKIHILDPLVVAMSIGIAVRFLIKFSEKTLQGFKLVPLICIPPGVALYGAVSLNFHAARGVEEIDFIVLLLVVFLVYIISALMFSQLFRLKEKVGYLIATGSSICGASAIVITSRAIDADPDDISVSLIAVFLSALIGLFIVIPLICSFFDISGLDYAAFSGSVLQFSGFVKASVVGMPAEIKVMALSIKAIRYIGLLFIIPLFSSLIKGKLYTPWYLWAFLFSGIIFSVMPDLAAADIILKPVLDVLWCIAMAAIGLNADIRKIATFDGLKTFLASLLSFLVAVFTFVVMNAMLFDSGNRFF